jgi:hypothetical protein
MGVEQTVMLPPGVPVPWTAIVERLTARAFSIQLRMIDGLPAFPEEEPSADWRELRVGTAAGMITLRRTPAGMGVTVWGNADPALLAAANALLWAVADVGGGRVETPAGSVTAAQFARAVPLPWSGG